jgi:asparagine synthase (glutamine-hydrolysing)
MCGICGKILFDPNARIDPALIKRMADTIAHRGPDDEGYYISGNAGLGHRRLSIIDLSTGKQPLGNEDSTVWVVFNGEIYNYVELRETLISKGHVFRTKSDTEVIVHAYEEYGEGALEKLRGMFAFALWDDRKKKLLLARDRVGIKPVYYTIGPDALLFASEIKAILADPSVSREINYRAVDIFFTYLYPLGPDTLFKDIFKLQPGHYLVLKDGKVSIKQYWDLEFPEHPLEISFDKALENVHELLARVVRDHMISDVPVGFLLSGGVDSTALLNYAVHETDKKISSFTIGFSDPSVVDERKYAKLAADTFGTTHYDMTITAKDFFEFLPRYVWHMEEPVCEPPAVSLFFVTELARKHVKVLISGEGGDEAFAGYSIYRNQVWLESIKKGLGPLSSLASLCLSLMTGLGPLHRFDKYVPQLNGRLDDYYLSKPTTPWSHFNGIYGQLYTGDFKERIGRKELGGGLRGYYEKVHHENALNRMLYVDTKTWLPDDLLIKADKMTMANSVELRVPLLDHQVLEFAASLPVSYKLHNGTTKYILKKAFEDRVPKDILFRKKTGFVVPYEKWIREDLQNSIGEVLLDRKTTERGYFDKKGIENLVSRNNANGNHSKEVFSLLTLEMWHRQFVDGSDGH